MRRPLKTPSEGRVTGRVVAVTGAGRGIGRAIARRLHAAGATVVLGDLDAGLAAAVAAELGSRAHAGPLDVTDRASFEAFLDHAESAAGPLDVLVNNAGIMPLSDLVDEPDEITRLIVDVNVHGVILGTKLAAARMIRRRRGHIVNIASGVGRIALPGAATYSASKYAVVGFTEAMRAELREDGVEVSCVLPVVVNTELASGLGQLKGQKTIQPEDVADVVADVLDHPRFEAWAPAAAGRLNRVGALLPRRLGESLGRAMGATDILRRTDATARKAYVERIASRPAGDVRTPDVPSPTADAPTGVPTARR